jgi:transcriptional regulator with XRE-family HTH domain
MLKSVESNNKKLEELDDLYKQAVLTNNTEKDIEDEADRELIDKIKEVYKIEDDDFKIVSMPQFIFAKRFRTILNDRQLNGVDAEEKLGIRAETISKFKNGRQYPSIDTILKIAKPLKISPYYLLGLTNYITLQVDEINRLIGLSEKSMKILFMLNHNVGECEELTDNVPVSNQNKGKLDILNSLIEDNTNFLEFLSCLEQYARLKEIEKQTQNSNKGDVKLQLYGLNGKMIGILQDFLKNIK